MEENLKQLLLKDLCARLPYKVICNALVRSNNTDTPPKSSDYCLTHNLLNYIWIDCYKLRPYLRPMSSMTEEEQFQLGKLLGATSYNLLKGEFSSLKELLEYSYKNHIDLFGLIPKGLALEASEDMYK